MKNKKTLFVAIGAVILILVLIFAFTANSGNGVETVTAKTADLVKTVKVSGKVVALEDVSLGFEVPGTVAAVYKKVGDTVREGETIVVLDRAGLNADLLRVKAELASAQAELAKFEGSAIGTGSDTKIQSAERSLIQTIDDAYTKADDAVRNKVDQFFRNPESVNPEIIGSFDNYYDLSKSINQQRMTVGEILVAWKHTRPTAITAEKYLSKISDFLSDVSSAVNDFKEDSSLTQVTIDKYKTDVSNARQNINSALSNVITASELLQTPRSDVPVQTARVRAAEATVKSYEADLARTIIVSPVSGIISKQDAKVGQAVSANNPLVGVISAGYKIEAYVPEVNIAGVAIGNPALVTLDAYPDAQFEASVSRIDPAETVRDGVSNYKIDLQFGAIDGRIKSGMTANVNIETLRKASVLSIPARSVLSKEDVKTVLLKTSTGTAEKNVEIGVADSSGNVEILSGLAEGDVILLNPVENK